MVLCQPEKCNKLNWDFIVAPDGIFHAVSSMLSAALKVCGNATAALFG
jgi:hypothetical protein